MSDDVALSFRGVGLAFGTHRVFEELDLDIPAGVLTGIVGPNGCGKSTLLRLADGLAQPSAGEVLVGGAPVASLSARERARRVALLPQVHRTPATTVRKLVACGRYAHMGAFGHLSASDEAAIGEALALMGLEGLAERPARALSGGERQRAFVAMALAQQAGTVMLDEPTTYLDVRASAELMGLVRSLADRGAATVVVVIHDLDLALRACDRLVVMGPGAAGGEAGAAIVAPDAAAPSRVLAEGPANDASVLSAIERVFGVDACRVSTPHGPAHVFFPR